MKKILYIHIGIIIFLLSVSGYSIAQDHIIKLNQEPKTLLGKNFTLENDFLKFEDAKNGNIYEISSDDVYIIDFLENGQVKIIVESLSLDTIDCQIDSISPSAIYYRQENQLLKSINRNEVFGIYFNENENLSNIDNYKQSYLSLHKSLIEKDLKIIRKTGEVVMIRKLNFIEADKANITITLNEVETITFLNISEIDRIILKKPSEKEAIQSNQIFILTSYNNWHSVQSIQNIQSESIDTNVLKTHNMLVTGNQKKETINGIFFNNYNLPTNYSSPRNKFVKLDVNYGFGYILGKLPEEVSSAAEKYLNELRLGSAIDANLKVFPSDKFGFGLKFNEFKTSNSVTGVLEDNLKVRFIGLSFTLNSKFEENLGHAYVDFSFGYIKVVNDGKIVNRDMYYQGSTIGVYISSGIDMLITKNMSIGIQFGLIGGTIFEFELNGEKVEPEEPDNLLRIDGMIGFKLYL